MKIGIVETGLPPQQIGGAELQAWHIAIQLQRKGHEVSVFTRLLPGTAKYELKDNISIYRVKVFRKPFGILSYILSIFFLLLKQRQQIDILLCFRAWPNGMIGVFSKLILQIPSCFSIRGGDWYFVEPYWWGKIIYYCLFVSKMPVLVQSGNMAREIRKKYPKVRPQIIPNGIQMGTGHRGKGDSIVYVGNLNPPKGVGVLLEAARQLPDCPLKIIGDGSDRKKLEEIATGLNVHFFGRVTPDAVRDLLMKHGKLLVLPSLYSEGFPNALLEAMSLGIPVIATDVPGGVRELLENGQAGILVPAGEANALKDAIENVWFDEILQSAMSQSGRKAAEKYSWPTVIAMWEQLFTQMHVR